MTRDEFYQKWNPGGTFNNPYSEHDKDVLDNISTRREFMADLNKVVEYKNIRECPECGIAMTLIKQVHGTPTHYWKCCRCNRCQTN